MERWVSKRRLERFWNRGIFPLFQKLGNKDISNVGDGTVTGAISELDTNKAASDHTHSGFITNASFQNWEKAYFTPLGSRVTQLETNFLNGKSVTDCLTQTVDTGFYLFANGTANQPGNTAGCIITIRLGSELAYRLALCGDGTTNHGEAYVSVFRSGKSYGVWQKL